MNPSPGMTVIDVPMDQILADPAFNCRGLILPIHLDDLTRSMKEHGLLTPITLQPYPKPPYRVVAGHRRHKAAELLGWKTIPAIIREGLSDVDAVVLNLGENLHRAGLNILQEAHAIAKLRERGLTLAETAKLVHRSIFWVQVRFNLLELSEDLQQEAAAGRLSQQQIMDLHGVAPRHRATLLEKFRQAPVVKVKPPRGKRRPGDPDALYPRNTHDILVMMNRIRDTLGTNFGLRTLCWAAGRISDAEINRDIENLRHEPHPPVAVPQEDVPPVPLGPVPGPGGPP